METMLILIAMGFGIFLLVSLVRLIIWSIRLVKSRAMLNNQQCSTQAEILQKLDVVIALLKQRENSSYTSD